MQIKYKGEHIQKSPFATKIYDIRKIKVKDVPSEICLGKPVTFLGKSVKNFFNLSNNALFSRSN